jgi:hypothetical protein
MQEFAYGSEVFDLGMDVKQSRDGRFFIGGETYAGEKSGRNIIILKTEADGRFYPGCGFVRDSHAVVLDTQVVPSDTYELPWPTTAYFGKESVSFKQQMGSYFTSELLCWNLNQPPENLSFERTENKSFFVSEIWHTITWSTNPYNSDNGFAIAEYKIYKREREDAEDDYSAFQHSGTVPSNIYIFVDKSIQADKQYLYAVTSVDSDGNESAKSDAVGNIN